VRKLFDSGIFISQTVRRYLKDEEVATGDQISSSS